MKVSGKDYRTVWMEGSSVFYIEQNLLPFEFKIGKTRLYSDSCNIIENMSVRGAGAIGAAAGFAMAQAFLEAPENGLWNYAEEAMKNIQSTRPTAQNLFYATSEVYSAAQNSDRPVLAACNKALDIANENAESCRKIGEYGNDLIRDNFRIGTHCNAGWLAFVDYGTALSPIYTAKKSGKKIFVYVSETRPRGQGAKLTAWELQNEGVEYAIMSDSAGAYLMSQRKIDMMIVGADRIARNGDVANKIGTLEKAIVAKEFGIPFYVAAPISTFDRECNSGDNIIVENRDEKEVLYQTGLNRNGYVEEFLVCPEYSKAINPAFDITPAKYITGIITEKCIIEPNEKDIMGLFDYPLR